MRDGAAEVFQWFLQHSEKNTGRIVEFCMVKGLLFVVFDEESAVLPESERERDGSAEVCLLHYFEFTD